jgi:hypothetical protein
LFGWLRRLRRLRHSRAERHKLDDKPGGVSQQLDCFDVRGNLAAFSRVGINQRRRLASHL